MTSAQESTASSTAPAAPGITDYQTPAQRMIGHFAPKLVELTDEVLFGDVWARPQLSPRDRSLITCAALVTNGSIEQLRGHLAEPGQNGLTETEEGSTDDLDGVLRGLAARHVRDLRGTGVVRRQ